MTSNLLSDGGYEASSMWTGHGTRQVAQPEPGVAGPIADGRPMNQSYWLALLNHDAYAASFQSVNQYRSALIERASSPRAQPEPEGPSVETMAQIVYENAMLATAPEHARPHWPSWSDLPNSDARIHSLNTAEIILTRISRPTIEPVPVSERPWEREGWCDAEQTCWAIGHRDRWERVYVPGRDWSNPTYTHLLPHNALPVPGAEVG